MMSEKLNLIPKLSFIVLFYSPDFTTEVGFIKCGLQTIGAHNDETITTASSTNKDEFCINMLRGFCSVMEIEGRNELANKVGWYIVCSIFKIYIQTQHYIAKALFGCFLFGMGCESRLDIIT